MAAEANDLLQRAQYAARDARQVGVNLNIELHKWLCLNLKETLEFVEEVLGDPITRGRCKEILRELFTVTKKVKSLVHDCCYEGEEEFIIAAIRLTDSTERFLVYYVELNWCSFLVEYMVKEDSAVKNLKGFDWNKKLCSIREDSAFLRAKNADRDQIVRKLKDSLEIRGDHRRICKLLLLRFGFTVALDDEPVPSLRDETHIKKGGQGNVWQVKWKDKAFAVKKFDNVAFETFRKEANVLRKCCHPHILNMICSFEESRCGKIMMDRMSKDLHQYIEDETQRVSRPFTPLGHVEMILQVAEGMLYLHEQKVVHRDLKPHNILLKMDQDELMDPVLKVADFGLAKIREMSSSLSDNTPNVGTSRYRAPELYSKRNQEELGLSKLKLNSFKADVFSFAITCSWILTGLEPYGKDDEVQFSELYNMLKRGIRPYLPPECHPTLSSLLQKCWDLTPSERPSFADICEELRLLKATLLTESRPMQSFTGSSSRGNLSSRDKCVRILVIGKPGIRNEKSGKASIINQLPSSNRNFTENSERARWLPSMPVCLFGTKDLNDSLKEIKKFVEETNKHWSKKEIKKSWNQFVTHSRPNPQISRPVNRLHMVWFVCSRSSCPNAFEWNIVTQELCDLSVQILVVETNEELDIDMEYQKFLALGPTLYPNFPSPGERVNENVGELGKWIVKVDLTDTNDVERNLWAAFEAVQPAVEVKLPAKIILEIREELGQDGFLHGNFLSKSESLTRSRDFVLTYLFDFWEVPSTLREIIRIRLRSWVKHIEVKPREFGLACGLAAALVLYIKGRHPLGLLSTSASNNELSKAAVEDFSIRHVDNLEQSLRNYFVDAPKPLWKRLMSSVGLGQAEEHLTIFEDILQKHFMMGRHDRDG